MHDRGAFWSPVPDWSTATLDGAGVRVVAVADAEPIRLVSGDVPAFLSRIVTLPFAGLHEARVLLRYGLRLAPDRVLVVASGMDELPSGWHDAGFAVTDVSAGYVFIDVTGAGAPSVMAQGSGLDFSAPPGTAEASAALLFAGLPVAIARRADGWRLHIERPLATALWTWLKVALTP